jgi:hypothetical protein
MSNTETQLTTCTAGNCPATFNYIAERQFPTLCLEHAADASRDNGWPPENSQN